MAERRKRRLALLAAVAVLASGLPLTAYAAGLFERLEQATVDARFRIRADEDPRRDIVLVAFDDSTYQALAERPPLDRRVHARVLDRLRRAGARLIGYDFQFTEPTERAADEALYDAVSRARPVVLVTTQTGPRGQTDVFGGDELVKEAGGGVGHADLPREADGSLRRFEYRTGGLRAFPVVLAEFAGRRVRESDFPDGGAWIDFAGPPGTIDRVSAIDVLRGRVPAERLRKKIVLVGTTDPIDKDVFSTSISGNSMAGVEIQANALATILEGFPLEEAPGWLNVLLIVLLAALGPLATARLGMLRALALAAGVGVGYLAAAQLSFDGGTILAVICPLGALVLGAAGAGVVEYATEVRERRRLRGVFGRFVPEPVIDQAIDRTDEDLRLGGAEMDATVMFCDLRGFTTWAETRPAATVIEVLNRYLTEMSEEILEADGTVVTYMGDGIMAVFGAPIELAGHADRALAAARAMCGERLDALNRWLLDRGLADEPFRIGVGLNSGPVMSGNVGSERRIEYTAVGDTTNTAARIEGLTKTVEWSILLSESTRERLSDANGLVDAGQFELRGRAARTRLFGT